MSLELKSNSDVSSCSRWSLDNKYIVVTGGTKGIGLSCLVSILKDHKPAGVMTCSRSESDVNDAISSFESDSLYGISCDLSTNEGRSKLVSYTEEKFPRIDCLVNVVGINVRKPIEDQTQEEYHNIMKTNVDSVYFLCKKFLPHLKKAQHGSSIVNVASAAGVRSSGTGAAYGMSKASVIHFSKILACEWANYNIRVNAIAPWMCLTPMLREALKGNENQLREVNDWTPMNRIAQVQEIVDPILFLIMDCSSYITGQCLGIDGGLSAQGFLGPCIAGS